MPGISKIKAGHLEKRKEWIRRTRDYKQKADAIKNLKVKARERNSDEFNFHMLRSQVGLDGVHRDMESDDEEQTEVQHLLSEITDINYVKFQLQKERKKIERLKSVLHFCTELGIESSAGNSRSKSLTPVNKHIIFETEKERRSLYAELGKRIEREKELSVVLAKLELKRDLQLSKGSELKPKRIRKGNAQRAAVYKWTYERKK